MKKKPIIEAKPVRKTKWLVHGTEYNVGDNIIVSVPELGVIQVSVQSNSSESGFLGHLSLGWIKTPIVETCKPGIDSGENALLKYSWIGEKHCELFMQYFCRCDYNKHVPQLRWRNVRLIDGVIRSEEIGINYHEPNHHPLVNGYEHLFIPKPEPVKKELLIPAGTQFDLFK